MDLGLRALDEVLDTADASLTKGESAAGKAWPTGFSPLDAYLSGPIRFVCGNEALTGLVLITWSASFTFLEMERFWRDR